MKYYSRFAILLIICIMLAGCSTAGPYVTNISSDGRGRLTIEKSRTEYNTFTGTISDTGSTTTTVTVIPEETIRKIEKLEEK